MSSRIDDFVEQLCELDLDPRQLRADPSGASWLPESLRRMVAEDHECARELAEFVEVELELYDFQEPCDPFFTRRVMDQLPELEAVDDRRRTWILASAYALAIGVGYVLLGPLLGSGEVASWVAPLHDWYHQHAVEAGGVWMVALLLLVSAALVVMPAGDRHSAA